MKRIVFIPFYLTLCWSLSVTAQTETAPFASNTVQSNRIKELDNLVKSINKNLSLNLTDSTEEAWQDAFYAMELILYHNPFVDARIPAVFDSLEKRSSSFQRAFLEMVYTIYPKEFVPQIALLIKRTDNPKLIAMCAEYLMRNKNMEEYKPALLKRMEEIEQSNGVTVEVPFFEFLKKKLQLKSLKCPPVKDLLNASFLPGEMVVYSFQRKNRNFPGLVLVRGKDGKFIKDANEKYFSVPQLARSNSNMPGYLTNGNTPQGIFKIFGFAVSKSIFIGPTTNIQMVLPYENSTDVADSITRLMGDNYRFLLPVSWKDYYPVYEAYFAGKGGRTEIIAHGTTVNPKYYTMKPYYPLTPTQGCLCTKEIWSTVDGKRIESDQQKLVDAVKKAGGASGYCLVIEIDDQQKPVSLKDVLPFIK
jgi:hypothetical protein